MSLYKELYFSPVENVCFAFKMILILTMRIVHLCFLFSNAFTFLNEQEYPIKFPSMKSLLSTLHLAEHLHTFRQTQSPFIHVQTNSN